MGGMDEDEIAHSEREMHRGPRDMLGRLRSRRGRIALQTACEPNAGARQPAWSPRAKGVRSVKLDSHRAKCPRIAKRVG